MVGEAQVRGWVKCQKRARNSFGSYCRFCKNVRTEGSLGILHSYFTDGTLRPGRERCHEDLQIMMSEKKL